MALQDKMKIDEMLKIRRMGRTSARQFIRTFDLTDDEAAQALALAMDEETSNKHDDTRLWMATAHILGASFAEIAADYGLARQSVLARVDRVLPVTVRASRRLANTLPLEHYSEYKLKFFANIDELRWRQPHEVGLWLRENTELDKQEETNGEEGGSSTD